MESVCCVRKQYNSRNSNGLPLLVFVMVAFTNCGWKNSNCNFQDFRFGSIVSCFAMLSGAKTYSIHAPRNIFFVLGIERFFRTTSESPGSFKGSSALDPGVV